MSESAGKRGDHFAEHKRGCLISVLDYRDSLGSGTKAAQRQGTFFPPPLFVLLNEAGFWRVLIWNREMLLKQSFKGPDCGPFLRCRKESELFFRTVYIITLMVGCPHQNMP